MEVGEGPVGARRVDGGTATPRRPEDRTGRGHDLRRRAVVAPEAHEADVGEAFRWEPAAEAPEVRRVGAGEAVDRLVGVADHAEVTAVAEPRAQQPELRRAGVLELVDEQMPEAPALRGRELGVPLEHVGAAGDEVVEVDQAALALLALVVAVDHRDLAGGPGRGAAGGGDGPLVGVGLHQARLGPLDLRRQLGGEQRALAPAHRQQRQQDPDLALEEAGHGATLLVGAPPELRQCDGVEGPGGDRLADAEPAQTRPQLTGRLPGEGDREDVGRVDAQLARLPRDAAGEHPGLARPRAGQDRQRRSRAGDRVALGGVETVEQGVHVRHRTARVRRSWGAPGIPEPTETAEGPE